MSTAGEKFFESLNNGELKFLATTTGVRMEDWEDGVSAIDVNGAVAIVASRRAMQPMTMAAIDKLTPAETQAKLEEFMGLIGFVDDEPDAEDLKLSDS